MKRIYSNADKSKLIVVEGECIDVFTLEQEFGDEPETVGYDCGDEPEPEYVAPLKKAKEIVEKPSGFVEFKKPSSNDTRKKVLELHNTDYTQSSIAEQLGITEAAVYYHLNGLRKAGEIPPLEKKVKTEKTEKKGIAKESKLPKLDRDVIHSSKVLRDMTAEEIADEMDLPLEDVLEEYNKK